MEQRCLLIPPHSRFPLRGEQILHWSSHLSCSFCSGDQCLCCNFNEGLRLRGVSFLLLMGPPEEARCRSTYLHFKLDSSSTDTNMRPLPRYKLPHTRYTRLAICFCLKDAAQTRPQFLLIQCGALLQSQRAEAFYLQLSKWLLSPRVWPAHQLNPNNCLCFESTFVDAACERRVLIEPRCVSDVWQVTCLDGGRHRNIQHTHVAGWAQLTCRPGGLRRNSLTRAQYLFIKAVEGITSVISAIRRKKRKSTAVYSTNNCWQPCSRDDLHSETSAGACGGKLVNYRKSGFFFFQTSLRKTS